MLNEKHVNITLQTSSIWKLWSMWAVESKIYLIRIFHIKITWWRSDSSNFLKELTIINTKIVSILKVNMKISWTNWNCWRTECLLINTSLYSSRRWSLGIWNMCWTGNSTVWCVKININAVNRNKLIVKKKDFLILIHSFI